MSPVDERQWWEDEDVPPPEIPAFVRGIASGIVVGLMIFLAFYFWEVILGVSILIVLALLSGTKFVKASTSESVYIRNDPDD